MLVLLFLGALSTDQIGQAERAQEMLNKNVYTAVIVGVSVALMAVSIWLIRTYGRLSDVQEQRIKDRDKFQEQLNALAKDIGGIVKENSQTMFVLTKAVDEMHNRVTKSRPKTIMPPAEPKEKAG